MERISANASDWEGSCCANMRQQADKASDSILNGNLFMLTSPFHANGYAIVREVNNYNAFAPAKRKSANSFSASV